LASFTHNTQQKVGDKAVEQTGCSKITFLTLTTTIILQRNPDQCPVTAEQLPHFMLGSCQLLLTVFLFTLATLTLVKSETYVYIYIYIYMNKIKTICFYLAVTA
jgi:hypothetical protein